MLVRLPPLLVGCDRCAVLRYNQDADAFVPVAEWGWPGDACDALLHKPISAGDAPLLRDVRRGRAPVVVDDVAERAWLLPAVTHQFRSGGLLALPLTARGALLGVILLDRDPEGEAWERRGITIALGIAHQAASAMESALLAQAAVDQARLAQEVRVAREIQTSLLPSSPPLIAGWNIAMAWQSARLVGGDFYDFWRLPTPIQAGDERPSAPLGFVIADVSDKGVPAALFMALARSLIRASALDGSAPVVAASRANRWITRDSQSGMFVTLFYGVLDVCTGNLRYTNAGHNPPLLVRSSGTEERLSTPGIALGVIEAAILGEAETRLDRGDVMVCYTDGITEAINEAEEEYGVSRLAEVVRGARTLSSQAIVDAVLADLLEHTGRLPAFDDVTLLVIKRNHESPDQSDKAGP